MPFESPDGASRSQSRFADDTRLGPLGEILVPFLESEPSDTPDSCAPANTQPEAGLSVWELRLRCLVGATAHAMAHALGAPLALAATLAEQGTTLALSVLEAESNGRVVPHAVRLPLEPDRSLAAWSLQEGETVVVSDLAEETRFEDRFLQQLGVASALAVPFFVQGNAWGVIGACDMRSGRLSRSQCQLAADVAAGLGELLSRLIDPPGGWHHETTGFGRVAAWNQEQRSSRRQRFEWDQRIAPVRQGRLPDPSAFVSVPCRDLSGSGISFFWDVPPDFSELVVALGTPPKLTFVLARVVWFAPAKLHDRPAFLLGCRFVRRVVI